MLATNINGTQHDQTNQSGMTDSSLSTMIEFIRRLNLSYGIIIVFIAFFIILGNTLVLIVTWRERSLRQPSKYFIAFLAVADLLVGVLVIPLRFYKLLLDIESLRTMSIHLCRFLVWIDTFTLSTSIYTLTFISFDRYLKISKPLQYKSRMTTSRSVKIIFLIVFISSSIATYAATPFAGSSGILDGGVGPCRINNVNDLDKIKVFYTFFTIIAFMLPTIFIMIMYVLIFRIAHKRQKMFLNGELGEINNQNRQGAFRQDLKVIKMLLLVVGVFICCWCPWIIIVFLSIYSSAFVVTSLNTFYFILIFGYAMRALPLLNSMCNPIIYACLDQTYREAFKRLFERIIHRPDSSRQQPPLALRPSRS
ncbi:octopamine receptor Oamb-like [Dendronephthya gigantea]|uniref:octopamine receptor Oamb-like n=1 Tax=Dendronephthya gigantea TaxID=151771 RepID=UPI00106B2913|nr:octopamine receptor Oamb-like [Dendronephthya gigantea]